MFVASLLPFSHDVTCPSLPLASPPQPGRPTTSRQGTHTAAPPPPAIDTAAQKPQKTPPRGRPAMPATRAPSGLPDPSKDTPHPEFAQLINKLNSITEAGGSALRPRPAASRTGPGQAPTPTDEHQRPAAPDSTSPGTPLTALTALTASTTTDHGSLVSAAAATSHAPRRSSTQASDPPATPSQTTITASARKGKLIVSNNYYAAPPASPTVARSRSSSASSRPPLSATVDLFAGYVPQDPVAFPLSITSNYDALITEMSNHWHINVDYLKQCRIVAKCFSADVEKATVTDFACGKLNDSAIVVDSDYRWRRFVSNNAGRFVGGTAAIKV
ncbi:hypothetical protein DFH27DRAFT_639509 [Peziza echinospora]|nr:hypothetical protein DFH27DRAFT_639509 [Peziza echinospora]